MKTIYDVAVVFAGEDPKVIAGLETHETDEASVIAEWYLGKLESTLERIETGKNGILRIGSKIIPVSFDRVPDIEITIRAVTQNSGSDPLHDPDGTPVFTETELATAPAVMRSVVATVTKVK